MSDRNLLKSKIDALFEILVGFMIVDWEIHEQENNLIIDFLISNFANADIKEFSLANTLKEISENEDNFLENATFLSLWLDQKEKIDVLLFISDQLFIDWNFSDKEYELFKTLMTVFEIDEEIIRNYK